MPTAAPAATLSTTLASVNRQLLRVETEPAIFSRGAAYHRAGCVIHLRCEGLRLSASVEGSRVRPYAVECVETPGGELRCRCSCPFARDVEVIS